MRSVPEALLTRLAALSRDGLRRDVALAPFTSFRIGGPAEVLLTVTSVADLTAALRLLRDWEVPFLILGGGSNVLVSDAGVPGVVILNRCRGVSWATAAEPPTVTAESGVLLAGLARSAIRRGLAGLTWAVHVPGTVGGAVVGNAGAHGGAIADNLHRVTLWQDGRVVEVPAAELELGYRSSRLKRMPPATRPVVLKATFHLAHGDAAAEAAAAADYTAYRRRTQPVAQSAGSIFKNPPAGTAPAAGYLIEAAGLKGYRIGGAGVSTLHANFILNHGDATAADVVRLMNHIRRTVRDRFGIVLEPEIEFVGEWREALEEF
ncbi:MAG: UDP-N-acetylmuramate dehydrogenase [Anaerolineae bacterium]|nr:UDP-N-acetylmuramate dehydrogenase [Caldilineales bacterium]MDW8267924.1 UDP-N-acetylmuramate dehydrogenase [Anaerolineae bacterium]